MISEELPLRLFSEEELFRHVAVFGSTGCGKTRSVILPLLASTLAGNAADPERRAGCLIFDVKGDMAGHLKEVMKAAGRTDKVIILGRHGNAWFDPFCGLAYDSRLVAERIIEMVRGLHPQSAGGSYDDFWIENNRRLLQVAVVIAKARGRGDLGGLEGIAKALTELIGARHSGEEDAAETKSILECLKIALDENLVPSEEIEIARSYVENYALTLAGGTWATISNYAQSYVSCLRDSKLAKILTPSAETIQFSPDEIIDCGRVVLVCLTRVHYGPGAEVYRNMIKTAFQSTALQRFDRQFFDGKTTRPVNAIRPVLFVADEFPSLLTVGTKDDGDAFFLDKCREVRVACILSAQGVSALTARTDWSSRANHLLNNCSTKIFMGTDCPETCRLRRQ